MRSPQVFRSIDSDSAEGFPQSNAEAASLGLDSGKGRIIEFSIQKAYINAIRQARRCAPHRFNTP